MGESEDGPEGTPFVTQVKARRWSLRCRATIHASVELSDLSRPARRCTARRAGSRGLSAEVAAELAALAPMPSVNIALAAPDPEVFPPAAGANRDEREHQLGVVFRPGAGHVQPLLDQVTDPRLGLAAADGELLVEDGRLVQALCG